VSIHVNMDNIHNLLINSSRKVHPSEKVNERREKERLGMKKPRLLENSSLNSRTTNDIFFSPPSPQEKHMI